LNNNTIKYTDKSTQTTDECELSQSKPATINKDELTQTDFPNLKESLSIHDCLSSIPYADSTNSPPPPVPYRRINDKKIMENCVEYHRDDNRAELNELSARNLQFSIDTSIGAATQTALAAVAGSVCDNGDIQCKVNENGNGGNL
jgi:hypothetical protein